MIPRNRRTSDIPGKIIDTIKCPITGRVLQITEEYYFIVLELYPDFLDIIFTQFNSGEPDCNVILRKTLLSFFEKHSQYRTRNMAYMVMIHFVSLFQCHAVVYRPYPVYFYWMLARKPFLTDAAYHDAPPDFRLYLSQLRNMNLADKNRPAYFIHNCMLVMNRLDNFEYALDEDTQHGEVAMPFHKIAWLTQWIFYHLNELIADGSLAFYPDGVLTVDEYTQNVLDAQKEGRTLTGPSRYGLDEFQTTEDKDINRKN